jgi:predicted ATPase
MGAAKETTEATFTGRTGELIQIRGLLDAVEAGETKLLLISGEPGIGKTRLLQELSTEAEARHYRIFAGRGTELEREAPFAPLIEALDAEVASFAPERLERLHERLPDLLGVLPALGPHVSLPAGSAGERFRHHRAIRALLEELAADAPLLLIVDDVHWADPASIEAIIHLLRHPLEAPILIALAHRPANMPPLLEALLDTAAREQRGAELELSTLTEEEAAGLLIRAPETIRGPIFQESGGNPFYIEQLIRALSGSRSQGPDPEPSGFAIPRAIAGAISSSRSS